MQYTQVVFKNGLCFKFWVIELPSRAISEILSVFQFNANYRKYSITLSHAQQKYSHRNAINEWNHHNYLDGKYGTHFCECQAVVRYSCMSAKADSRMQSRELKPPRYMAIVRCRIAKWIEGSDPFPTMV